MQRDIPAIFGIIIRLLLIFICVAAIISMGVIRWWSVGQDKDSRLIRIIPVAPLITPQVTQIEGQETNQTFEVPVIITAPKLEATAESRSEATKTSAPSITQETEKAPGLVTPEETVNPIVQEESANRLVIPTLYLDAPMILAPIENQTWSVDHLGQAVGYLEGTAPPGSGSNTVLAAHVTLSTGDDGPFAELAQLAPGDNIFVHDNGQTYQYIVDGYQLVDQTTIEVTYPSAGGQITLITCSNWDDQEGQYIERLIVTGHLVEK